MRYRADIDGLRAVAVILVVLFHAFPETIAGGFVGVDVFFVISGFLISSMLVKEIEAGGLDFSGFYMRRVRRIFPALIVVLVACYLAGWLFLLPLDFAKLGLHIFGGAGFFANLMFWHDSGYFDSDAYSKPLLHLWSLGVEEQFYIFWPLLLVFASKWRSGISRMMLVIGFMSLASSVYLVYFASDGTTNAFYSPIPRFWELISGALLAYAMKIRSRAAPMEGRPWVSYLGLLVILVSAWTIGPETPFPGLAALPPVLGACMVIYGGLHCPGGSLRGNLLTWKPMVGIGLISYPLYLWHWPILVFHQSLLYDKPAPLWRLFDIVVALCLSILTYFFVERPLRVGGRFPARIAVLAVAMAVIGCGGLFTFYQGGFYSRFPSDLQALANFSYDSAAPFRTGECFLHRDQVASDFGRCTNGPGDGRAPSILIWGDSYAAMLYEGFAHRYGTSSSITQFTSVGCYPVLGRLSPTARCKDINAHVIRFIRDHHIDRVVLACRWSAQGWPGNMKKFRSTIAYLHGVGVRQVDIIGQPPEWHAGLSHQLYKQFRESRALPLRMNAGVLLRQKTQASLSEFAVRNDARFISVTSILCDGRGCMTMIDKRPEWLTAFDYGHLTKWASDYVVDRFPDSEADGIRDKSPGVFHR